MNDAQVMFDLLQQSVDPAVAEAIEQLVDKGTDRDLARVNVLAFAASKGIDAERMITGFLHAAKIGLFDMSWNVLCPGCGTVLESSASLKSVHSEDYNCALCAAGYEPTLDEMVEVTFTVSPRVRRIEAHNPDQLSPMEYMRQVHCSSQLDLPENFETVFDEIALEALELPPGEKAIVSLQLPAQFIIIDEPVTHTVQFIDVKGEPTKSRQALSVIFERDQPHHPTVEMNPGPVRILLENRLDRRVLPLVLVAGDTLHEMMRKRRPFLTAKRLLSHQTFRDLYRADTLDVDQRLKITSLTFLFTDLRGSTELYERVGDLVAFDLVRAHFQVLQEIVVAEAGAVVKTIGDAVMATFPTPDRAISAALKMRDAMGDLNDKRGSEDLLLKIGVHEGPCIAVMLNERQDYFGQTVNIASRVQHLATSREILTTAQVIEDTLTSTVLEAKGLQPTSHSSRLRGIVNDVVVYAVP
jgi:class 3 adenylate cyclase